MNKEEKHSGREEQNDEVRFVRRRRLLRLGATNPVVGNPGHIPDHRSESLPRRPTANPRFAGPRTQSTGDHEFPGHRGKGQSIAHRHFRFETALEIHDRPPRSGEDDVTHNGKRQRVRDRSRAPAGRGTPAVRSEIRLGDRRILHVHADIRTDRRGRGRADRWLLSDDTISVDKRSDGNGHGRVLHAHSDQRFRRPHVVCPASR